MITWAKWKPANGSAAAQWAERLGIPFPILRMRLHRGWPIEKALTP